MTSSVTEADQQSIDMAFLERYQQAWSEGARWTSSRPGPDGSKVDVQGCDFYEFRDGLVGRKIAFRKSYVADG